MNKDKLRETLAEFKRRDEERVKEMQQQVIADGGDLGPDMVLMVMVDRVKDLSTLVAVMANELVKDDDEPAGIILQ